MCHTHTKKLACSPCVISLLHYCILYNTYTHMQMILTRTKSLHKKKGSKTKTEIQQPYSHMVAYTPYKRIRPSYMYSHPKEIVYFQCDTWFYV